LVSLQTRKRLAIEYDGTFGGCVHPGHHVEARCFAGTIGPNEPKNFTLVDMEVDVVQGGDATELHSDMVDGKQHVWLF
jgi:hypothetical protein